MKGEVVALPDYDAGWRKALANYRARVDDHKLGREHKPATASLTVVQLCDQFLVAKYRKLETGKLGRWMFEDYREVTDLLVATFGRNRAVEDLTADDFGKLLGDMATRWGAVRLGIIVSRIKSGNRRLARRLSRPCG